MQTFELLKKLTSAVGVSGAEGNIVKVLTELLEPYGDVSVDCLNNVYCKIGNEGYHILIDAHLDEIGFIVKEITEDGFIKVSNIGGVDRRMLLASEVSIWGDKEYYGVISNLPPHLQKQNDEKKAPEIDEISIDIGMAEDESKKHISLGDRVTFRRHFTKLLGNQVSSNVLDDRCGVAAIILALDELKKINANVTVMFSSQEEVGTRGAKIGAYDRAIDEAIVVDVSFGYSPLCKKTECGDIGKGPMIGVSPILDRDMSRTLADIAEENNIPYQLEVMGSGHTGTNADVISVSEYGIKTALISIPEKYMHSPIEVIDITDVENTSRLIVEYVKHRMEDFNA